MSNYMIKSGDTLWKIIKEQCNLTNATDIANKVKDVAKANHISNPNSIFAGKSIEISSFEPLSKSVTGAKNDNNELSKADKKQPESVVVIPEKAPQEETKFTQWTNECADSMKDIDEKGQPIYDKDVNPFDMAGEEFTNDIKNNGGKNAGQIYTKKALDVSTQEIGSYDLDKDGQISPQEQVAGDLSAAEKKYGKVEEDLKQQSSETSLRANVFMDLDKNGKVDKKEYAAFMYAMDANNDKKIANGKISREEYVKATGYFEQSLTEDAGKFRGTMRASYKGLFGVDPAETK